VTAADTTDNLTRPKGRRIWWVALVPLLAIVMLVVLVIGRSTSTVGNVAKPFDLQSIDPSGSRVVLTNLRGRPLVINFWASWCIPCRSEMPGFEHVHQHVGERIQFVGVDHQDTRPSALELLHDTGVTYPTGFDPDGHTAYDYGLVGMPTTVFISADGKVLEQHTGQLSEHDLQATIDRLYPPQ
jgi:cytochrome c biogenesis protein CcmG/thiol:disulfide interchange protein DsbE